MNRTVFRTAMLGAIGILGACAPAATTGAGGVRFDRSVMPPAGAAPEYDFPDVQSHTLSNGLRVWLVERPGVPLVTVQLLVDAGAVTDPEGRSGLASLTAAMLTEGTTRRSATQIADEIDFLAANLNAGAGQEVASVTLSTLARNLMPAMDIFTDVIANPAFAEGEWARVRDQRLVSLVQALDQPTIIATQQFARRVYGEAHPYGRPVQGTPESVQAISPAQLRDFHRSYYRPGNANLIVVGDVRAGEVLQQLERALSGWQGGAAPAVAPPAAPAPQAATRVYLIDKPGAAQSEIRIGHVGVERTHRDYFPLLVMNTILGGQFSSRINLNLREDKGYTYGARSNFQMGRIAGPFVASAGVQTAVTKESVVEFMRELEEIRDARPVTEEEVEFARTSIIRREPLTLETNAQIGNRIQELILYDLPLDYFDDHNRHIAAVNTADVNRVAREYLQPGRFAIVIVGDRSTIEQELRTLPYPVDIVAIEGQAEPVPQQRLPGG
ncbi:MAG: insulinase family protein [Gemmatimonadetes bacterium]|nr:insulinase family protein [Gemmatimonadota bacterium]